MEYFTNTGLILSKFYRFENSWIRYFIYFMWYNSIPFNLCFQSYLLQMQKHFSWIFVDAGSELHLFIGLLKFFLFSYWSNVKNSFLSLVDQVNKSFLLTNIHSFQWEHFFSYFSCVILVFLSFYEPVSSDKKLNFSRISHRKILQENLLTASDIKSAIF